MIRGILKIMVCLLVNRGHTGVKMAKCKGMEKEMGTIVSCRFQSSGLSPDSGIKWKIRRKRGSQGFFRAGRLTAMFLKH